MISEAVANRSREKGDNIMLYKVGFRTETKEDVWAGKYQCPKCEIITNHHLYIVKICHFSVLSCFLEQLG